MAFNFYPQYQTQQYVPPQYPQPQYQQNSIIWVQGIEGAKAYPVGAGNSVLLMDSDGQYLYIKSADNTGMPTLRIFEYTEITERKEVKAEKLDMSMFVTRDEMEEALSKLEVKKRKKRLEDEDYE